MTISTHEYDKLISYINLLEKLNGDLTIHDIEILKDAAGFIGLFKGSTNDIDAIISRLSGEEYHSENYI